MWERNVTKSMSDGDDRRKAQGAARQAPEAGEDGMIHLNLREHLEPEEFASFKAQAEAAGRTVAEHFKAITFQRQGGGQGQAA